MSAAGRMGKEGEKEEVSFMPAPGGSVAEEELVDELVTGGDAAVVF